MIRKNVSLRSYNTFGVDVRARFLAEIRQQYEILTFLSDPKYANLPRLILGGGSNVLFTKDFEGLVLVLCTRQRQSIDVSNEHVLVTAAAGEPWPEWVDWCVDNGWGGLENLSLIPGTVGASPIQNIGAYGSEAKDVFSHLEALDLQTNEITRFDQESCRFGYRDSIFKNKLKNRYIILSVSYLLNRHPIPVLSYPALKQEVLAICDKPGIRDVADVVKKIRRSKLPDPQVAGNAGSFFKNPVVARVQFENLIDKFPGLAWHPAGDDRYKLSAAWMIDTCGLKGTSLGDAAVHINQPLVIVNNGNATGMQILTLAWQVREVVYSRFGVSLEEEINIY